MLAKVSLNFLEGSPKEEQEWTEGPCKSHMGSVFLSSYMTIGSSEKLLPFKVTHDEEAV